MSSAAETWWSGARTWPSLIGRLSEESLEVLASNIERDTPYLTGERALPRWQTLAALLGSASESLARAVVLHGSAASLPANAIYTPSILEAIDDANKMYSVLPQKWTPTYNSLLTLINILYCCGHNLPPQAGDLASLWMERLLPRRRYMKHDQKVTTALAAVAHGQQHLVPRFLGGGALPRRLIPGQTFGADIDRFVRYLAVATDRAMPAEVILPEWTDFLARFPYLHTMRGVPVHWYDLIWCGHIVFVQMEHRPVRTVVDEVHAMVRRVAEDRDGQSQCELVSAPVSPK